MLAVGERSGLSELIAERVRFKTAKVRAAGVNPVGKLTSIIAGWPRTRTASTTWTRSGRAG